MLYTESWQEYHHTEYMIFVFLAAVGAADVALLRDVKGLSEVSVASIAIATALGLASVLVTWRQKQSRKYRMGIIEKVERLLYIDSVIGKEHRSAPRLGNTLLFLSVALFVIPLVYLAITLWH